MLEGTYGSKEEVEGIVKSENGKQSQQVEQTEKEKNEEQESYRDGDENVLKFMDSLDGYLTQIDSLSALFRQGWFDLASARYSMGASRINSAMLDLNVHPAATSVQVSQNDDDECPHFTLHKWMSCITEETEDPAGDLEKPSGNPGLRHRGTSETAAAEEESLPSKKSTISITANDQVQKERAKLLAMFGTFVSPKLRSAQLSFESALEILVEIANMRSSMISAHVQVRRDMVGNVEKRASS